nr:unnamed protein product [Callosobruchus chinensis]
MASTVASGVQEAAAGGSAGKEGNQELEKNKINDAVTKALQGYDWTAVPIASKALITNPATHNEVKCESSHWAKPRLIAALQ